MKILRPTREKGSPKYDNEKANKVKNQLSRLNVDEQQDAIKLLKEYFDTDVVDPNEKKAVCIKK